MKRVLIIVGILAGVMLLVQCSQDFLEVEPRGEQDYDSYFLRGKDAEKTLVGIYHVLQWDAVHGQFDWVYGDVISDDTEKGGENDADQPEMREIELFTHHSGNSLIAQTWSQLYTGIFRCNLLLEKIDNIKEEGFEGATKNRILGETKFLRAYYYFRLNIMFNGVPLITRVLQEGEFEQPRATPEAIWAQIEQDLNDAKTLLPEKAATDLGRATKGAAYALLAKVHLYQEEWAEAQTNAEAVIASGSYDLEANYFDVHLLETENGIESIFEVQSDPNHPADYDYNGWGEADLGTLMCVYWLARPQPFGGWGFNVPTDDLKNAFVTGDRRRNATIASLFKNLAYGLNNYNTKQSNTGMCPRKYIVPTTMMGPQLSDGPANFRILRLAEMYLIAAEAAANQSDLTTALNHVNKVRERARNSFDYFNKQDSTNVATAPADYSVSDFDSKANTLELIYLERRCELALEGQRFFDLVRWAKAEEELSELGFVKGKHEYYPIPLTEIEASKGALKQNPGY